MRYCIFLILALTINFSWGQSFNLSNQDGAVRTTVQHIDLVHTVYSLESDTATVSIGQAIGKIAPYPAILSERFQAEIMQSRDHYNQGEFKKAYKVLEQPLIEEPTNKFIKEAYARALYQLDNKRSESYQMYKELISELDRELGHNDSLFVIDVWYREAYWKLGTLHMDNKKWLEAFEEISRFVLSIQDMKGSVIYDQALTYLTECAFYMKHKEMCKHFAKRTLFYNPNNTQVNYYLDNIE